MQVVHGNTLGLKPSQQKALSHLYRRRLPPAQILSPDLARSMCEASLDCGRQVGVLVDRTGAVTHVIVGDQRRLFLPDLGRARAGSQRFRGLRLLHTHLQGELLSQDDLTDLSLLRLDLVAALTIGDGGLPGPLEYATLHAPDGSGEGPSTQPYRRSGAVRVHQLDIDFIALIEGLEGEFASSGTTRSRRDPADPRPRAILVGVDTGNDGTERRVEELARLADTAGLLVVDTIVQRRAKVDPRTLVGQGKLEELLVRSMYLEADLLVFDRDLSPAQGRTLSDETELKVIDRTQLILDIFAQHAHSADGRLQVELAQLKYLLPRLNLVQKGLSRLTGGVGGRGPGETRLEIRSRRARDRIASLERQLEGLSRQRAVRRSARRSSGIPVVSIVGYTNAGKSTLLNALTRSDVLAEDKLFATLDPTSRRLRFPDQREVLITDTVGFIEHLPEDLKRAFASTLEELQDASLILHVLDAADPWITLHQEVVEALLDQLELSSVRRVLVYNKADTLDADARADLVRAGAGVVVSALRKEGLDELLRTIESALHHEGKGDLRPAWLRAADPHEELGHV